MKKGIKFRSALAGLTTALALSLGATASPAAAAEAPSYCQGPKSDTWVHVVVEGVRNSNGLIGVTLYDDDSSKFLASHGSMYTERFKAKEGRTSTCIFVPKTGVYAIVVYHDENGNRKFDRSGLGLPTEGFGFTNNPSTLAGIPTFSSVRLNIGKTNLGTKITLRYP
ncbi:DUF2141 domain-containing protein [Altericroceibacterium spongiae]|uniref:DUF2141 domain-containing protein n=1 Tax=Altericroceibacterium spongiae TaxID=2320269 RepID=A0A420EP69_9SPHN|nr:DUF2141 domain-containing protein [Altericroceibacterium spongiae]RKF22473.1 DUF2141 domain-containing protein [Altericroceibacterium spongiae]